MSDIRENFDLIIKTIVSSIAHFNSTTIVLDGFTNSDKFKYLNCVRKIELKLLLCKQLKQKQILS